MLNHSSRKTTHRRLLFIGEGAKNTEKIQFDDAKEGREKAIWRRLTTAWKIESRKDLHRAL